jgi:hypothetical protein
MKNCKIQNGIAGSPGTHWSCCSIEIKCPRGYIVKREICEIAQRIFADPVFALEAMPTLLTRADGGLLLAKVEDREKMVRLIVDPMNWPWIDDVDVMQWKDQSDVICKLGRKRSFTLHLESAYPSPADMSTHPHVWTSTQVQHLKLIFESVLHG